MLEVECYECKIGYYLDQNYSGCRKCSDLCEKCYDYYICDKCAPGNYLYKKVENGKIIISCITQCVLGTLPYAPSLYYLNQDIYPNLEKVLKETKLREAYDWKYREKYWFFRSDGIGLLGEPLYNTLPYQLFGNEPIYDGNKVAI